MGILKETGDTIMKYGQIIIKKNEDLAKIAKLNLEIKGCQLDIGIAKKELGQYVLNIIETGASTLDLADPKVKELDDKVDKLKADIQAKKDEIQKIKTAAREKKSISGS